MVGQYGGKVVGRGVLALMLRRVQMEEVRAVVQVLHDTPPGGTVGTEGSSIGVRRVVVNSWLVVLDDAGSGTGVVVRPCSESRPCSQLQW